MFVFSALIKAIFHHLGIDLHHVKNKTIIPRWRVDTHGNFANFRYHAVWKWNLTFILCQSENIAIVLWFGSPILRSPNFDLWWSFCHVACRVKSKRFGYDSKVRDFDLFYVSFVSRLEKHCFISHALFNSIKHDFLILFLHDHFYKENWYVMNYSFIKSYSSEKI